MLPIHERILTLLREIDGICRENGIVYYLHGGTLLGAVRQGGFLPWDDDGDVIMTRENWEKFLAAFDRAPLPGRALECLEHHPKNLRLFPRYLDTGTTMAFITGMENTGYDCVTVDILIFEELPREEGKRRACERWLLVLGELVCRRYVLSRETPWGLYRLCRLGEKLLGRRRVEGWIRRRMAALCRGEETDYIQMPILYGGLWVCPRRFLGRPEEVELEGHPFYAPTRPREFLRHVYGDSWMMAPPARERHTHTENYTFHPYSQAAEDCRRWIDPDRLERAFLRDKELRSRQAPWVRRGEELAARYHALAVSMALEEALRGGDPARLLAEGRFPELEELAGDYLAAQLGKPLRPLSIPAPAPEEALWALGMHLTLAGRYWDAQALLEIHRRGEEAGGKWGELRALIGASREVSQALYDRRDPAEAADLARPWLEKYPRHEGMAAVCLGERLRRSPRRETAEEVCLLAREALGWHPDSPRLKKVLADALLLLGQGEEALPLLREAAAEGPDVFLRREAAARLEKLGEDPAPELPEEPAWNRGKTREIQEKLLTLLEEVDGVCRKAGVPYFLGGLLAAEAAQLGGFAPECCSNYIIMHPAFRGDFLRAALEALPPGRGVDCFETNPRYADFSIRWWDTGSLMMDVRTEGFYQGQGVAVQIQFLRPDEGSPLRRRLAAALCAALEGAALPRVFHNPSFRKGAAGLWARAMMALLGRRRFKRICWRLLYRPGERELRVSGRIKFYWSRALWLPDLDFGSRSAVFLEGREFPVPVQPEDFLRRVASPGWNHGGPVGMRRQFPYVMEPRVPAGEYLRRAAELGLRRPYARARGKAARIARRKNDWPYVLRCWRILCRSIDRIRLRARYLPRREELGELWRRGDWDALGAELADFTAALEKYARWGMGIAFDSEIFRMAWAVMEREGRGRTVERMLSRIPAVFFEGEAEKEKEEAG